MDTQIIVNLLNDTDNKNSKFAIKELYVDSEPKGNYSHENPIQFLTNLFESSLCDYSDAYILVTGNITVKRTIAGDPVQRKQLLDGATQVVFKNCAPFKNCRIEINDTFVHYADFINITMPISGNL